MKKIQHKNTAGNVKLLFTNPKQAFVKINKYTKASNQKRKAGAVDYWVNCGDVIQR
jgi:hypothetical protein